MLPCLALFARDLESEHGKGADTGKAYHVPFLSIEPTQTSYSFVLLLVHRTTVWCALSRVHCNMFVSHVRYTCIIHTKLSILLNRTYTARSQLSSC